MRERLQLTLRFRTLLTWLTISSQFGGGRSRDKIWLSLRDRPLLLTTWARMSNRVGNVALMRIEERHLIALPDCPEFVWTVYASHAGVVDHDGQSASARIRLSLLS